MITMIKYPLLVASVLALAVATPVFADPGVHGSVSHHAACDPDIVGMARCHARVVDDGAGKPIVSTVPTGYGPAQFLGAYGVSGLASGIPIIAIVDAYDHPSILSDLNTYSAQFGIPALPACSGPIAQSSVSCFQKKDQRGGTRYPRTNAGWALEIALDIQAAHAVCQNCSILLVEADTNSIANLVAAVDRARLSGAQVISNSYGSAEFSGETAYDSHFAYPGIAFTVSAGDSGYGVEYPAASQYVTAVGGTTLSINPDNSYAEEQVWAGTGSGCSQYETKPAWQSDTLCSRRTVSDVSADADPATSAAIYDSVVYQGRKGWFQVGGTSLAAPLIAAIYAQGRVPTATYAASLPYVSGALLHDVTFGNNGSCGTYLCTAGIGYDGPTGMGTPFGSSAF